MLLRIALVLLFFSTAKMSLANGLCFLTVDQSSFSERYWEGSVANINECTRISIRLRQEIIRNKTEINGYVWFQDNNRYRNPGRVGTIKYPMTRSVSRSTPNVVRVGGISLNSKLNCQIVQGNSWVSGDNMSSPFDCNSFCKVVKGRMWSIIRRAPQKEVSCYYNKAKISTLHRGRVVSTRNPIPAPAPILSQRGSNVGSASSGRRVVLTQAPRPAPAPILTRGGSNTGRASSGSQAVSSRGGTCFSTSSNNHSARKIWTQSNMSFNSCTRHVINFRKSIFRSKRRTLNYFWYQDNSRFKTPGRVGVVQYPVRSTRQAASQRMVRGPGGVTLNARYNCQLTYNRRWLSGSNAGGGTASCQSFCRVISSRARKRKSSLGCFYNARKITF